jgi:hypothetical protein
MLPNSGMLVGMTVVDADAMVEGDMVGPSDESSSGGVVVFKLGAVVEEGAMVVEGAIVLFPGIIGNGSMVSLLFVIIAVVPFTKQQSSMVPLKSGQQFPSSFSQYGLLEHSGSPSKSIGIVVVVVVSVLLVLLVVVVVFVVVPLVVPAASSGAVMIVTTVGAEFWAFAILM